MRGLTARLSPRSTILMDGVPLAYAPYCQPQLPLAPLAPLAPLSLGNLQTVDVVRGAGSVRYGPQNVGGIINFVTRPIPQQFTADASVGTEIYSHGGDAKTTPNAFIGRTNANGWAVRSSIPNTGATYVTQEDTSGRLGDIRGYPTLNLRTGHEFGKELNNLKLAVGVKDLFDPRHFTRSTDNNGGKYVGQPLTVYMQAALSY